MSVTKVSSPMIESGTKGADIASAATVVIGTDGSYFDITGTTGISTQFTVDAGRRFTLQFNGAVTITDNAAITLSGAANFTTAAGDILSFVATAANTVVQTGYSLVDGGSPVAPAAGGSWTLIGTAVASNSASLTVTGIDSTYDLYAIGLSDLHPVDDTPALYGRVGDSGGIDTGGTDYAFHLQMVRQNAAGYDATWDTSEGKFKFANEVGNSTGEGVSGLCWLARPADGVTQPMITGTMAWINGSTILYQGSLGATRMAVIAIDRIQCFFSSGNIESGRMTIWGVKHT